MGVCGDALRPESLRNRWVLRRDIPLLRAVDATDPATAVVKLSSASCLEQGPSAVAIFADRQQK